MKIIKGLIVSFLFMGSTVFAQQKPNILLIAVDDLNDWIGVLGGHPQAQTPHMDRLAKRGVLFTNAQCQSPVCNPSRASMMSSLYPSTTGIYFLNPSFAASPKAKGHLVMPKRFEKEGFQVSAAGKLFHNQENKQYFKEYGGSYGGFGPRPKKKISPFPGHPLWDWGVYPESDDQMPDAKIAVWGEKKLALERDKPFFMGIGFYRPHVPQFAPQKWFDMYPLDEVQLPKMKKDDLADISQYGIDLTREEHVAPTYEWVVKNKEEKKLVQSYLACVSFVDAQVGKILDALDQSAYKDNTYVVLYSDHGFHFGEKERYAKRSIWADGSRVPMMIVGPGIKPGVSHKPVQLMDIYPTLLELTNLKADSKLEGNSLVQLLRNPQSDWPHYARSSFGPGNYAIVSERYRYVQYNDGSEEFYDRSKDPHEWNNQIKNPEYAPVIAKHREQVPAERAPILGQNSTGHKAFNAAEAK
jgi:arylsulfatase A-like enzyme